MVFATVDDNATRLGINAANKSGYDDTTPLVTAKAVKDEGREPADGDSDDDSSVDSGYNDFLSFLSSPSPKSSPEAAAPKKIVEPPVVKAVPVRSESSWAVAAKAADAKKAQPTYVEALSVDAAPVKAVPMASEEKPEVFERKETAATVKSTVSIMEESLSSEDSSVSEWSSEEDDETEDEAAAPAPAPPAPMMKAKSLGRGQLSSNDLSVESFEETKADAAPAVVPVVKSAPSSATKRASMPPPSRAATATRADPKFELPKSASIATFHFEEEKAKKAEEIEAARAQTQEKEPVEPLPVDYFTKQGDAMLAAKAEEARKLAESEMPIGISYFTAKAEEDKVIALAEQKALSEQEMAVATKHFKKLEEEKAEQAAKDAAEGEIMPAAIQHFTVADRAIKDKKRQEIEEMRENPPPMPVGVAVFTNQMLAEKEKQRAEIEAMKESPPPASVATEYFKEREEERQLEIERMMNEPAPPAIEYFTQKDREEKEKSRRALEAANSGPYDAPPAVKYFAEQEEQKAAEIEAARKLALEKMRQGSSERPQINWAELTKQTPPTVPAY